MFVEIPPTMVYESLYEPAMGVQVMLSVDDSQVLVKPFAGASAPVAINVKLTPEHTLISETVPAFGVPVQGMKSIMETSSRSNPLAQFDVASKAT